MITLRKVLVYSLFFGLMLLSSSLIVLMLLTDRYQFTLWLQLISFASLILVVAVPANLYILVLVNDIVQRNNLKGTHIIYYLALTFSFLMFLHMRYSSNGGVNGYIILIPAATSLVTLIIISIKKYLMNRSLKDLRVEWFTFGLTFFWRHTFWLNFYK